MNFRRALGLLPLALLWALTLGLETYDWGWGRRRGLLLLAVALLLATSLLTAPRPARFVRSPIARRLLLLAGLAVIALQIRTLVTGLMGPHLNDIAGTTLDAARIMLAGGNPYAAAIDPMGAAAAGPAFGGYKYLPAMPVLYMPLGLPFGAPGVLVTNALLEAAVALLVARAGAAAGRIWDGIAAAIVFLSLPIIRFQLFREGVTDLVPVLAMLAALAAAPRKPALAGLAIGLSLSAKLLPAAAVLPCCLPGREGRAAFAAGLALGLAPTLLYAAADPAAFWANIVAFNATRPVDGTGWASGAPDWLLFISRIVPAALWLVVAAAAWAGRARPDQRYALAALLVVLAILAGPVNHQNYHLWWLPLATLALMRAGRPFSMPIAAPRASPSPATP